MNDQDKPYFGSGQSSHINTRERPVYIEPDRPSDIKITNCQEKDDIWTATGQFGRESRHSKRVDITYDKEKFRFIQKDDQGSTHVFEIPVTDIEGKYYLDISSVIETRII